MGGCFSEPATKPDYHKPTNNGGKPEMAHNGKPKPGPYYTAPPAAYGQPVHGYPTSAPSGYMPQHSHSYGPQQYGSQQYGSQQYPHMGGAPSYPGAYPPPPPGGYPGYGIPPPVSAMPPQGPYMQQQYGQQYGGRYGRPGMGAGGGAMLGAGAGLLGGFLIADALTPDCGGCDMGDMGGGF